MNVVIPRMFLNEKLEIKILYRLLSSITLLVFYGGEKNLNDIKL